MNEAEFAAMARRLTERCPGAELLRVKVEWEYNADGGPGPAQVKAMWSLHAFTGDWYHVVCSVAGADVAEEKLIAEIEDRRLRTLQHQASSAAEAGRGKPTKEAAPSVQPDHTQPRQKQSAG